MLRAPAIFFCLAALLFASLSHAKERVLVVVDVSAEMWERLDPDTPRIVAVRTALGALLASPETAGIEFGLRSVGGTADLIDEKACADTETLVTVGKADPIVWQSALDRLDPRGKRPLATAITSAVAELRADGGGRVVVITAGGDTCNGDIPSALDLAAEIEPRIEARIIGLDLDRETANAATLLVPTHNVRDPRALLESLRWAVLPEKIKTPKAPAVDISLTRAGKPAGNANLSLTPVLGDGVLTTTLRGGNARLKMAPGEYRLALDSENHPPIEISGITITADGTPLAIDVPIGPEATLAVLPERPEEGGTAYISYWGAPTENSWIVLARPEAPANEYLHRIPVSDRDGVTSLPVPPGSGSSLEVRLLSDLGGTISVLAGRRAFDVRRLSASVTAPESARCRAPITISWHGPHHRGDHISIIRKDASELGHETCLEATADGSTEIPAPVLPGLYSIRYVTTMGQILARSELEVFEVLATVSGPARIAPRIEMSVEWTGPARDQDFIAVARLDSPSLKYIHWAPVSDGNPARLRAPYGIGEFELRYVRGSDGSILARAPLVVEIVRVELQAPKKVEAGSRFEVHWTGTAGENDFIAVAATDSDDHTHLDWSYLTGGSPITLAAPFEPGIYDLRYHRGDDLAVRDRKRFRVE